jgi:hypothetical protein
VEILGLATGNDMKEYCIPKKKNRRCKFLRNFGTLYAIVPENVPSEKVKILLKFLQIVPILLACLSRGLSTAKVPKKF